MNKILLNSGKMFLRTLIFLPLFFIFTSSVNNKTSQKKSEKILSSPLFTQNNTNWVDSVFNSMTVDEKIGQLFMVAAYPNKKENKETVTKLIKENKVGGLIMFQCKEPAEQVKLTNYYQSISKTPLMIAGDYEWGLSMRIKKTVRYPRQMMLGAIPDDRLIYAMGADIAEQCHRMGININFAPVIDINNNANNPVINSRSFGELKVNVAQKGIAYMLGLQDNNIITTGKHFPGHGDTDTDSHKDLPVINHKIKRLDSLELFPFKRLIKTGMSGIMIAHLNIPALDSGKNVASSLSNNVVTKLLKNKLNFKGLIFTDALNMKGVAKYFEPGEVDVKALLAGVDILLMSEDVPKAVKLIKEAIKDGKISQAEIDKRVQKILKAKNWMHVDKYQKKDIKNLIPELTKPDYIVLRNKLIESALTLAVNKNNIIPFKGLDTVKISSVAIGNGSISNFQKRLSDYDNVRNYAVKKDADKMFYDDILRKASAYDVTIVSVHKMSRRPPEFGINENTLEFIDKLSKKTKVVLVLFGNPYALRKIKNPEKLHAVLVSYNDWKYTRDMSAQLLYGGIPAKGQLPVSAGKYFKAGQGSKYEKIRLKYGTPIELKIKKEKLKAVDSVILRAIRDRATPGASVMAIKNGIVFYRKSFGYHNYKKKNKTLNSDIFDLASLTKVSATTISLMRLYEEGKFDINKKVSYYLPELKSTNKKNIKIKNVLAHQARLKAWIPFYLKTYSNRDSLILDTNIYHKKKSAKYPYKVADNLYVLKTYEDTIFKRIYDSKLRRRNRYKYSDMGFYMFYKIIEKITKTPLENFVRDSFYAPLGATSTGYKPLDFFDRSRIVPTENDTYFRKQHLQGYVHDFGAALTDLVNGHAGLFSNANDLAKVWMMLLNNGKYGGKQYLKPETIKLFTKCVFCTRRNRRALGFDKPKRPKGGPSSQIVSNSSFGHSGFTGILVWADPKYDFLYIFLSNRINPNMKNNKLLHTNIRTKVQRLLYESFL